MPALGGAINDALDFDDDRAGSATTTIGPRYLVMLAARTENRTHGAIGFRVESPLIAGLGASYKVRLGVVPA